MTSKYSPSGKFHITAFIYFILAALIFIPIVSTIYAYAIWYIPFPYINFFITAGFGLLVGLGISFLAVKLGKVRNGKLATLFGFIGGLLALYFHWAVWIDLVLNISDTVGSDTMGVAVSNAKAGQVLTLLLNPGALFSIMSEIQEYGTWGIKQGTVKGTPLTVIWVIEALMVFVISLITPAGQSSKPFCELNEKWFDEKDIKPLSHLENPSDVMARINQNDFSFIENLDVVADPKSESHTKFLLFSNETNENYLTVTNVTARKNDKDEIKLDEKELVRYISVSEETSKILEAKGLA